ncbi:MAG: substrate-binding domain-containing protein [Micromonosporaceae bacterium]|nr:substrate-binding domain-containing protein [Micromonosporaceae bacterium]
MRSCWRAALALLVSAALAGCGGGGGSIPSGELTIVASPSLTDAVTGMVHAYTTTYPAVQITTVFEPDSRIAERAAQSPPPDLIVAEDPDTLRPAGITTEPVHVARGQIVLAVPPDNPLIVRGLADLARPEVRVARCDPAEPCGAVTDQVLAAAGVTVATPQLEPDVRSALRRVTEGDADVALVYRSDAIAAQDEVIAIEVPESSVALADFVAAVPPAAPNPTVARMFLDYLASSPVRDALTRDGFRPVDAAAAR